MRLVLLGLILQHSLFLSAQQTVMAKGRQQNTFYLEIDNPVDVLVEGYKCSSIFLTTDNGKIERDECYYNYHAANLGSAHITIYKKEKGKSVKLKTYEWFVIPLPKPVAQVGGFQNGSHVSKGALSAQPGIAAGFAGGLGIDRPYEVSNYFITIIEDSTIKFAGHFEGALFNDKIRELFKAMKQGAVVSFTNIQVRGSVGELIKVTPLEYTIE